MTPSEHALVKKDLIEIWNSKMARATLIAIPVLLVIVLPSLFLAMVRLVPMEQAEGVGKMLTLLPENAAGYNLQQGIYHILTNLLFPLFYLIIPLTASAVSASCIFVGEKERSTIETLLLTPLRVRQIFRAKLSCCMFLSFLCSAISFAALTIVVSVGDVMLGLPFFVNWEWLAIIFLLAPSLTVFGVLFMVFSFNRSSNRLESFQMVAYAALPLILLYIGQFAGFFRVDAWGLTGFAIAFWLLDLVLWFIDRKTFLPEKFLYQPPEV